MALGGRVYFAATTRFRVGHEVPFGFRRTTPAPHVTVDAEATATAPALGEVEADNVLLDFAYLLTLAQHYNSPASPPMAI